MNVFKIIYPGPELSDIVEMFWYSRVKLSEPLLQDLHTPILQSLTFNLEGLAEKVLKEDGALTLSKNAYVIGQPLSRRISESNAQGIHILGVKFTHMGLATLTDIPMRELSDGVIEASEIWGSEIHLLHEQLLYKSTPEERVRVLEIFLCRKRGFSNDSHRAKHLKTILELAEQHHIFSLSQLRERAFISKKTLERYFLEYIGVSPKQYINLIRFNKVAGHIPQTDGKPDWEAISLDFGYYDASHLIRDFHRFAGKPPSALVGTHNSEADTGKLMQLLK